MIEDAFDGLRRSPEPWAWAQGGPRTEDIAFTEMLPIPEVDGGGIDVLDELERRITPKFESVINGRDYHIASAFVLRETDEREDAYVYTVTFSAFVA